MALPLALVFSLNLVFTRSPIFSLDLSLSSNVDRSLSFSVRARSSSVSPTPKLNYCVSLFHTFSNNLGLTLSLSFGVSSLGFALP